MTASPSRLSEYQLSDNKSRRIDNYNILRNQIKQYLRPHFTEIELSLLVFEYLEDDYSFISYWAVGLPHLYPGTK